MGEEDGSLQQVAWLVSDALRTEEKAADFDRRNCSAEAILHHKRASSKLSEAASLCPDGHPDKSALSDHAQDIATRVVYLQSLGGAAATMSLEDHVGEVELTMDLSSAPPPPDQDVAALVAGVGVSGQTAPINEESCRLVLALKDAKELRAYVLRLLQDDWRRLKGGADAEASLDAFAAELCGKPVEPLSGGSLEHLRAQLREASWAELNLDPNLDRLKVGAAMEREARDLEAGGQLPEALRAYERAVAVFQLVYKFDPRSKNPKIKEMVGGRIEELQSRAKALQER